MALFVGNDTHHGTHGEPSRDPTGGSLKWAIRPTAKTIKIGPTEKHWEAHVAGTRPLGVIPITTENLCSWGSIDYDVYDDDLLLLIAKVEAAKLPLVPCRSKSGGLHLWLFTTEPVESAKMQAALREIAASLGISGSEIFPKQSTLLSERGEQGSWMIMPYFGGTFDGKLQEQTGMKKNGASMTLAEFIRVSEKAKQTPEELEELTVRSLTPKTSPKGKAKKSEEKNGVKVYKAGAMDDTTVPFGDGPPCLVHLTQDEGGVKQGGQNNTLFHMGVYFKRKFPDDWRVQLETANQAFCVPPHPSGAMDSIIKSLEKKDYQYKCKDQPMLGRCDAILCRKRRFGVGGGGVMPVITSLKKLDSDPPVWFLDVEGGKIECGTEDLQKWERFQRLLMDKVNNPFGLIKPGDWLELIRNAMSNIVEIIEASPNAGQKGEFRELLEIYLTNRQRGTKEEDLLTGRPWEDEEEGRHYFQLRNLVRFMQREGLRNITQGQVVARIVQDYKGGHVGKNIKGKFRNLHWVPSKAVEGTPDVAPPYIKGSHI